MVTLLSVTVLTAAGALLASLFGVVVGGTGHGVAGGAAAVVVFLEVPIIPPRAAAAMKIMTTVKLANRMAFLFITTP
jgi:hypothetical protein